MKKFLLLPLLFLMALVVLSSCGSGKCAAPADTFSASIDSFPNGAVDISQTPSIQIKFTQAVLNVNTTTVSLYEQGTSGKLQAVGSPIPITNITAGSNNSYTFSPLTPLISNTTYVIALNNGITTLAGVALTPTTFNFTTGDFITPMVSMITPANGVTGASLSQIIQLQFSESVTNVDTTSITLHAGSVTGAAVALGNITAGASNSYSFSSTSPLSLSTTYYVVLSNAISDVAGNPLEPTTFSFTTSSGGGSSDTTAPTVVMTTPTNNATDVSITPGITLQFSEPVTNVTTTSITLHAGSVTGTAVALDGITGGSNNSYSFSPASSLSPLITYYVVLSNAITDIAGNPLTATSFSFTTVAPAPVPVPEWSYVGESGVSAGASYYTSLVIAPDGTPYVAYEDDANGYKATVMKFNGSNWVVVGTPGIGLEAVNSISLAIALDGTPYLAYQSEDSFSGHDAATVMKFNGSNWVEVGFLSAEASNVAYTNLAIASNGTPYVAYKDRNAGDKATVKRFNGTNWVGVGATGFSAGVADYTSLAISESGTPYVAYTDANSSGKATVKVFDGTNWVNVGTAGFSAGFADAPRLAITPNGTPYVAYRDAGNSGKATVMMFDGSSWVNVGTAGFSAGGVVWTSLAIAPNGIPFVAYCDVANADKATVMMFDGNSWVPVGNPGFSTGSASYTSLAIDSNGMQYVAYRNMANSGKATVMSYQ